jgi:hypothetical protein
MERTWMAILLAGALCSAPLPATEVDDDIGKAHYQLGTRYYVAGRYQDAVKEFLEAHRLTQRSSLLYNIAKAYEVLHDPGRATTYYQRYLASVPAAREAVEIKAKLFEFSANVGRLIVHCSLDGSEIFIDGILAGTAPLDPVLLTIGKHQVEARHADRQPGTAEVEVRSGLLAEIPLEPREIATPLAAPPPVVETKPAVPPLVETRPVAPTLVETRPALAPPSVEKSAATPVYKRWWLWTIVGVVVAGAVAGIAAAAVTPADAAVPSTKGGNVDIRGWQ